MGRKKIVISRIGDERSRQVRESVPIVGGGRGGVYSDRMVREHQWI